MKYDSQKHHRRSIRIPMYDYSQDGWYFVTICVNDPPQAHPCMQEGVVRLPADGEG